MQMEWGKRGQIEVEVGAEELHPRKMWRADFEMKGSVGVGLERMFISGGARYRAEGCLRILSPVYPSL